MARSIGKRNITKLRVIVREEIDKGRTAGIPLGHIYEKIQERIPPEWSDIWESAWSEIEWEMEDEVDRVWFGR